ncbi:MAG: hypothetical protein ACTIDO_17495 [Brevibacterium aurantiacum]|uniref:hypothetical protein n=1 Tax=Brevibacterium aurantiacum TaxID=273384 RepID=UPI003F906771
MVEPDGVRNLGARWLGPLPEGRMEAPEEVFLAEVRWSPDTAPECFADPDPLVLMREVATIVHHGLQDSPAYEGATGFLDGHAPPEEWDSQMTVVTWLRDLARTTDFPSVTIRPARLARLETSSDPSREFGPREHPVLDGRATELPGDDDSTNPVTFIVKQQLGSSLHRRTRP